MPGNFDEPSHRLLRELASEPRFAAATRAVERPAAAEPMDYLSDLAALGCRVEAWETTYLHVLSGSDPVFDWISGTGAGPYWMPWSTMSEQRSLVSTRRGYARRTRRSPTERCSLRRIFVVAQLTGTGS